MTGRWPIHPCRVHQWLVGKELERPPCFFDERHLMGHLGLICGPWNHVNSFGFRSNSLPLSSTEKDTV